MGRKTKEEKMDMPEQLAPKTTTKRARRKQEVLPEVKALLEQAEVIKQNAKAAQKNAAIAERIFKLVDKMSGGAAAAVERIHARYGILARVSVSPFSGLDGRFAEEAEKAHAALGINLNQRAESPADEVAPRD